MIGNGTAYIFSTTALTWDDTIDHLIGKFAGTGGLLTSLNASNIIQGTLPIDFGGTGANSFIENRLLIGGTIAIS